MFANRTSRVVLLCFQLPHILQYTSMLRLRRLIKSALFLIGVVMVVLPVDNFHRENLEHTASIETIKTKAPAPTEDGEPDEALIEHPFPYKNTGIPNILIAGVQKAGTTSLAHYLMRQSDRICFSDPTRTTVKTAKNHTSLMPMLEKDFRTCWTSTNIATQSTTYSSMARPRPC